jgi:Zn-finger nucleic acid-binding protein
MKLISTSWTCQRCGGTFLSAPPEHRICGRCLADLEAVVRANLPESVTCPSCGGPAYPDCGQAMTVLVPVPVPAPASVTEQVTRLIDGYRQRHPEVTGDDT